MAGSDENNQGVIGPANLQGGLHGGVGKIPTATTGHNRRALSNINNGNIIGAPPYACAINKRGPSERNAAIFDKNPPIPPHHPITRKIAAQTANMQQPKPEETKDSLLPQDSTIIDVEDHKAAGDVPMFVQHTEAMLEEIYHMEEVEIEDVVEEPVADIDSCDKKNPLAVVEYIDDIYDFYKETEASGCVPPSYMLQQFDINEKMRGILIDWLIEVHYKFELMAEPLYLTINLIDRFLAVQPVVRKKLQLVGVTAMLVACKYEEVSVPVVEVLIQISDEAYSRKEMLEMFPLRMCL